MLMFSRNSHNHHHHGGPPSLGDQSKGGVGEGPAPALRNPTRSSRASHGASRSSYYEPASRSHKQCEYFGAGVREKIMGQGTNTGDQESGGLFKRTSSRSSTKKSPRPHSWHSTLQKGFHRARSRSAGREGSSRKPPGSHNPVPASNRNSRCGKDFQKAV